MRSFNIEMLQFLVEFVAVSLAATYVVSRLLQGKDKEKGEVNSGNIEMLSSNIKEMIGEIVIVGIILCDDVAEAERELIAEKAKARHLSDGLRNAVAEFRQRLLLLYEKKDEEGLKGLLKEVKLIVEYARKSAAETHQKMRDAIDTKHAVRWNLIRIPRDPGQGACICGGRGGCIRCFEEEIF